MKYRELVSVVIPCFKQADFLAEAIESVQAQTYTCHEIIVIDDGSPDNTEEVARRYPTVRYLRQDNRGLPSARNAGIRASHGNYLVFLDADDRLLPAHFELNLQSFESKPEAAIVCGDYRLFGTDELWHVHRCDPMPDHYGALLRSNFIGPPHPAMFRREVVLEVGMFREKLTSCEDLDLYLRVAKGRSIYCHCQVVAEYRRHAAQMSRKWAPMLAQGMKVLWDQWEHVQGNLAYEQAFRAGIKRVQHAYGEPLLWQMVAQARSRDLIAASRSCWTLLQYYPQSLSWLLRQKVERTMGSTLARR
jgi:glycosyltransferase involved in cell wall biosynthesis